VILRSVTWVNWSQVDWVRAARLGIVVATTLAFGVSFGNLSMGVAAATAALLVSFTDANDPYPLRARVMLSATFVLAAVAGAGALLTPSPAAQVVGAAGLAAAAAWVARYGPKPATIGRLSLAIYAAYTVGLLGRLGPVASVTAVLAGAGALTALSLSGWLLGTSQDVRGALGRLWRELSLALAAGPSGLFSTDLPERLEKLVRQAEDLSPAQLSAWTQQVAVDVEAVRLSLLDLLTQRAIGRDESPAVARIRQTTAAACWCIGRAVVSPGYGRRVQRALIEVERACAADPDPVTELEREHVLVALQGAERTVRGRQRHQLSGSLPGKLVSPAADADSWLFRHVIRMTVLYTTATVIGWVFFQPHGGWLPLTTAMLLMPGYADTIKKVLGRIVGTAGAVLLGILAVVLLPVEPAWALVAVAGLAALAAGAMADASYPLRAFFITLVMTAELALRGQDLLLAMEQRFMATIIAAVLVVAASLVYPLRKAPDIPKLLAEAARAAQAVVVAAAERLSRPQLRERMRTARHCRAAVQQALDAGWVEHWGSPVPVDRGEASLTALSYASQNAFRAWLVPGTAFNPEQEVAALQEFADMMERADDSGVLHAVEVDGAWLTSPDDGLRAVAGALAALGDPRA